MRRARPRCHGVLLMARARGILFLCVANSARSQMAEGLARLLAPVGVEVFSAGSSPTELNPHAVTVMAEIAIDISSQRSKAMSEVPPERVGVVVTLCAEEACPLFGGDVRTIHWPLEDPAAARGSDARVLEAFRRVRDDLRARITDLLQRTAQDE